MTDGSDGQWVPRDIASCLSLVHLTPALGFVILSIFTNQLIYRFGYPKPFPSLAAVVFLTVPGLRGYHERTGYRRLVLESLVI